MGILSNFVPKPSQGQIPHRLLRMPFYRPLEKFRLFFVSGRNSFSAVQILSIQRTMISPTRPLFHTRNNHLGFTLIELLVVISIIAILAGLGFPAVGGAIDAARKTRASSDVAQIATAVVAYETEYGKLPTNSGGTVDTEFLKILTGTNTTENPRRIVFLETSAWQKGKGGTNSLGFCDPWDSNSVYQIALDTNYVNSVTAGTNSTNIMKKVAVWNNPTSGSASQKNRRYVTSW